MRLYVDTKPTLEWVEDRTVDRLIILTAKTEFGDYKITYKHSSTGKNCKVEPPPLNGMGVVPDLFFAMSEGKMFAQADYDRRTAERFKHITLPDSKDVLGAYDDAGYLRQYGASAYKKHIETLIKSAIAKAKEQP